jgi:heat shock protein HslJ
MKKWFSLLVGVILIGVVILVVLLTRQGAFSSPATPGWNATDPQTLMIPRWFLNSMLVDGKVVEFGDNLLNLQFEEGGNANGEGGCNSFFATYQAGSDGSITFGPVGSTKMACAEGMQQENDYFTAISRVTQFRTAEGQLTLASADGKTVLTFNMPPK